MYMYVHAHEHVLWTEDIDWGKVRTYTYNVQWHTTEEREGEAGEWERGRKRGGGGKVTRVKELG